jgi:hypothetical protein
MDDDQELMANGKEEEKPTSRFARRVFLILCTISLLGYLAFSQGLRFLLSGWKYHIDLFKIVFPKGFLEGLPRHAPLIPSFPNWNNGLLLLGFLSCCIAAAWLVHSLLRGRKSDLGPHLILFSFATAIVPTLLMAVIYWPDGRGHLTLKIALYAALFIVIFLVALKLILSPIKNSDKSESPKNNHEPLTWAWFFMPSVVLLFLFTYMQGSLAIIGYDALAYHLPLAASWFHNGRITRGFDIQFYSPGNTELMMRWCFLFNSEQFLFLVPFIAAILCIFMIYKLGRVIGQGRQSALVAACCAATFPLIPFLATTANTDIMGVLFLLLTVFFLIRWMQSNLDANRHLICSGLAAGLAAGTKLSMLTSIFTIVVVALVTLLRSRKLWRITDQLPESLGLNWSWLLIRSGIYLSAALIGGGYWYLWNLFQYGNPLYPIAMFGLSGIDLNTIVPLDPVFISSPWKMILYPWTEITYNYPYDHGIGLVAAGIVIPSLLLFPYLLYRSIGIKSKGPGVIYAIACISLIIFASSGNMIMRHGIFAAVICFVFVGEIWEKVPSLYLRALSFAAFLTMILVITHSLVGGYLYEYLGNNEKTRSERLDVPVDVDILPPSRIFNAASSSHTYGLMGRDYRHEVVTLFKESKSEDVLRFGPTYVLLNKDKEETFRKKLPLERVGSETHGLAPVSLWKLIQTP